MKFNLRRLMPKKVLWKELAFNIVVTAVILTILTSIFLTVQRGAFRRQVVLRAESLATLIAQESEFPMLVRNRLELDRLAQSAISGEDVAYVLIRLADGTVSSAKRPSWRRGEGLIEVQRSVVARDGVGLPEFEPVDGPTAALGHIRVGISLRPQEVLFARTVRYAVLTAALAFGGMLLLQFFRLRRFLRPIQELVASTERVRDGDLEACHTVASADEIGELTRAFNRMVDGLREYRNGLTEQTLQLETANARLLETEERYALAVQGAKDGIWDWDIRRQRVYYSPRWKAMLGYTEAEVDGTIGEWFSRIHPEDGRRVEMQMADHLSGAAPHFESEYRIRHKDGGYRWMLSRGQAVRNADGKPSRVAGSQTDVTENKVLDPLTGLPNRILLHERLALSIARARRDQTYHFAVLFLDLDGFKLVNDSLGHLMGDALLAGVARRLRDCLRGTDAVTRSYAGSTAARLGGDEFGLLIDNVPKLEDTLGVAERILHTLEQPFELDGHEVVTSASIGIAFGSPADQDPADLLRNADIAMYRAKLRGKGRFEVFDDNMRRAAMARLELEIELRQALERGEFMVHYQPKVLLADESVSDFEALIRWQHPVLGLIPPANFVPVAEETGLIVRIGHWILRAACLQAVEWNQEHAGRGPISVSVNLSPRQLRDASLVEEIAEILCETQLDPKHLDLEITESTVMDDPESALETLTKLKAMGVRLSIDDFGTGYSSLNCLHRFPFDTLKIDRSFVKHMDSDRESSEIVRAVVTLGNRLGLTVVAEGLESREQVIRLRSLGCGFGQGYYFSPAVDAAGAGQLLLEHPRSQAGQAFSLGEWRDDTAQLIA